MEAAKKAGDAKAKALAKAGVSSKSPSITQKQYLGDESKEEHPASPEKDVYEGQGSKDPDREAVVPDSKETLSVRNKEEAGASNVGSNDPDAEAVVPDSKTKIDAKDTVPSSNEADVPVPENKELSNIVPATKGADNTQGNVPAEGKGRSTTEDTTNATAASDEAQDLPGKRTQDQEPADAEEVGASVAD